MFPLRGTSLTNWASRYTRSSYKQLNLMRISFSLNHRPRAQDDRFVSARRTQFIFYLLIFLNGLQFINTTLYSFRQPMRGPCNMVQASFALLLLEPMRSQKCSALLLRMCRANVCLHTSSVMEVQFRAFIDRGTIIVVLLLRVLSVSILFQFFYFIYFFSFPQTQR